MDASSDSKVGTSSVPKELTAASGPAAQLRMRAGSENHSNTSDLIDSNNSHQRPRPDSDGNTPIEVLSFSQWLDEWFVQKQLNDDLTEEGGSSSALTETPASRPTTPNSPSMVSNGLLSVGQDLPFTAVDSGSEVHGDGVNTEQSGQDSVISHAGSSSAPLEEREQAAPAAGAPTHWYPLGPVRVSLPSVKLVSAPGGRS